jgi:hypothetical protein
MERAQAFVPTPAGMAARRFLMERTEGAAALAPAQWPHFEADDSPEISPFSRTKKPMCDKRSLARGVMLHLRACYVSKAAILTIPAR